MKFFVDNCIAHRIVKAVKILAEVQEHNIVHLTDKFQPATKDVEWISTLAKESGWVIVSGDSAISRNKAERKAWNESGLTAFFFDGVSSLKLWKQAEVIVKWWPHIVLEAEQAKPGTGYLIQKKAKEFRIIYEP